MDDPKGIVRASSCQPGAGGSAAIGATDTESATHRCTTVVYRVRATGLYRGLIAGEDAPSGIQQYGTPTVRAARKTTDDQWLAIKATGDQLFKERRDEVREGRESLAQA